MAVFPSNQVDIESGGNSTVNEKRSTSRNCCNLLFQSVVFSVCCFLFISQSMMLVKVYLSFPTTITTNLTFAEIFDLPSVTLCFKSDLKPGAVEAANEVFRRNFNADKAKEEDIKCNLMIPTINQVTGTFEVSPIPCHEIVPTLESINFGLGKRCYTFFSKLGKPIRSSRDLKVRWSRFSDEGGGNGLLTTKNGDLMTLEIEFGRKPNMEAFTDDLDASISIHQSNELPLYRQTCNCLPSDINVRRDLLRSNDTFCTNSKCQSLQIHRAEFCATLPRCKPNCEDELYNFVTEMADSQSTTMVLTHYINTQRHRTSSRPINYNNGGAGYIPRPMVPNGQFQSYGLQEAGTYHGSLSESVPNIVNVLGTLSKAFVTVRKSSGPDVVYEHRPQYNYFDFVFQLMTLACVWLGFSIFSIIWKPFYIIFKIISFCCCLSEYCNEIKYE